MLETLNPAERLAFVLHDMFDVSFDDIAPIVSRSPTASRQLASRARRRVRVSAPAPDAFQAAARGHDLDALLAVLDPDVVLRVDRGPLATSKQIRGAAAVIEQARTFARLARYARPARVNGSAGTAVISPTGPLAVAGFAIADGRIVEIDLLADPARVRALDLSALDD